MRRARRPGGRPRQWGLSRLQVAAAVGRWGITDGSNRSYRGVVCKRGCCSTNGTRVLRVLLIILHSRDLSIHHFVWRKLMTAVVFLDSIGFEPRIWPYIRLIYAAHTLQQARHGKLFLTAATRSGQRRPP